MSISRIFNVGVSLVTWLNCAIIVPVSAQETLQGLLEKTNSLNPHELQPHHSTTFTSFDFNSFSGSSKANSGLEFIVSYDKGGEVIDLRFGPTLGKRYYDLAVHQLGEFVVFDAFKMDSAIWGYGGATGEKLVLDLKGKRLVCVDPNENALILLDFMLRPISAIKFAEDGSAIKAVYQMGSKRIRVTEYKLPVEIRNESLFSERFSSVVEILEESTGLKPSRSYDLESTFNPYDLLENIRMPFRNER